MLKLLRNHLTKIIEDIDAGNSNITEDQQLELVKLLGDMNTVNKRLSKYSACKYLNISRTTFDNLVREGKLPKGTHEIGFKELSWSKKSLDEYIKKCKK